MPEFRGFPKIERFTKFLNSPVTLTEKIDGTNACVVIEQYERGTGTPPELIIAWDDQDDVTWGMYAQSRKRLLTLGDDNYGFALWVREHCEELKELGHGHHFGEWWGGGIQRNYGLDKDDKRLSLFNVNRPVETLPACCSQVPVLDVHTYDPERIRKVALELHENGSAAAPGFPDPEGVMIWHSSMRQYFKLPFDPDPKGK